MSKTGEPPFAGLIFGSSAAPVLEGYALRRDAKRRICMMEAVASVTPNHENRVVGEVYH